MNLSDLWDWDFFWTMFRNFVATVAPFIMIIVAISAMGLLLTTVIRAVKSRG